MPLDDEALSGELRALARAHGVTVSYLDHGGVQRTAPRSSVVAVLESIGVEDAATDPTGALAMHQATVGLLDDVAVLDADRERATVRATVPAHAEALECELVTEDGEAIEWRAPLLDRSPASVDDAVVAHLELPRPLPVGYHALTARAGARASTAHLFARPPGGARGRFGDVWRGVGIAAPLFTLHSARSWGCGDLADLDALAALAAPHGASVVATLPLLAGFGPTPFEPSPYLPVSRLFWHERWLDVDAAVDGLGSAALEALANVARDATRAAAAAGHPYVDGEGSLRAKRGVLDAAATALGDDARTRSALDAYLTDRPAVAEYARFRAAGERHGTDWTRWPAAQRDGRIEAGDVDAVVTDVHALAQWLADAQLRALAERLAQRGQVLSLDLPLGVHPRGYDVWRHRGEFLQGLSVGAPPDRFFPRGQVWGFPPPRVAAARANGHTLFRAALVHHLNVAGMLRIDHVLGTQRLFCVPEGRHASDGAYVRMPLEELLAVVSIEAQRHRAAIVGEDLGTVDAAVRRSMQRDGIRRTSVVQLSIKPAGAAPFVPPPDGAVTSFSTHDLPTFEGWWRCRDVDERVTLGQVDDVTGAAMRAKRLLERARLASLLDGEVSGSAAADDAPPTGLLAATHQALADSDAGLVLLQLDDVLGEQEAVNLPGTSTERRNWQRRTSLALEQIASDPRLAASLDAVRARRPDPEGGTARGGESVATRFGVTRLDARDEARFVAGRHARLFDHLGAHPMEVDGEAGTYFAVWAPSAAWVEVVGDFNGWDGHRHPLERRADPGIWEGFVPDVGPGERYKFRLASTLGGDVLDKADPFAGRTELPPGTASIVHSPRHAWGDAAWMATRAARQSAAAPISVYEVHLGSWRRDPDDLSRLLTYGELAPLLIEHVTRLGFTHVELLPVMEHPFYASWGYQLSGYFAPTARYGTPDEFAALVDELHRAGIGVLLDWVPAHFPDDEFSLGCFDGTHLFEHPDPRMRVHPDWHSLIFNYARGEVRSFLLSAACSWIECYHADGLRFDAVASMLYLDYSRGDGEWVPNHLGGNENLDAVALLQTCNEEIHRSYPGAVTVAEESTSWPGVTAAVDDGGLGFDYKWDLGWMHDTLDYLHKDPVHRRWHHDQLTFRSVYATSEQFLLPLSHDEVVHGKGSLLEQMAGTTPEDRLANLRLLLGYQLLQPGKKLLFMGDEFGQVAEWSVDRALDWDLLSDPGHAGLVALVAHLNALYRDASALHRDDLDDRGFRWLDADDRLQSVLCLERHDGGGAHLVAACNATPRARSDYRVGLPESGAWRLVCSSDEPRFGGSGHPVAAAVTATEHPWRGRPWSALLELPPLGFVIYAPS